MGLSRVALMALPPLPVDVHVPAPANACTTPVDVTRRMRQLANSLTSTDASGSTVSAMGLFSVVARRSRPFPLLPADPVPAHRLITRVPRSTARITDPVRSQISSSPPYTAMSSGTDCRAATAAPPSPVVPLSPAAFTHVSTKPVVRFTRRTRRSPHVPRNKPSLPHTATPRAWPNAVALAHTPLRAMLPAVRQEPLPATAYVCPVPFTATNVQRVPRARTSRPLGSTAM